MVALNPRDLHWFGEASLDQCAHGALEFSVGGVALVKAETNDVWNLTATGLFLLRTLDENHWGSSSVTDGMWFVRCCAHFVLPHENAKYGFAVLEGCGNGFDIFVRHVKEDKSVRIGTEQQCFDVSEFEWREAVKRYISQISEFYNQSEPKREIEDAEDREGWRMYWEEWIQRCSWLQPNN